MTAMPLHILVLPHGSNPKSSLNSFGTASASGALFTILGSEGETEIGQFILFLGCHLTACEDALGPRPWGQYIEWLEDLKRFSLDVRRKRCDGNLYLLWEPTPSLAAGAIGLWLV